MKNKPTNTDKKTHTVIEEKDYLVKTKEDKNYWVYEISDNGKKCIGIFDDWEQAHEFIDLKKYKEEMIIKIEKGELTEEELPF